MTRRQRLSAAAFAFAAVAALGCELLFGLDDYSNGKCPPDKKACPIAGEMKCVPLNDINTGCGRGTCTPCSYTHGYAACISEMCVLDGCQEDWANCNMREMDGCETDLAHDPGNCDRCNNPCTVANGWGGCSARNCTIGGCKEDFEDCDKTFATGCEVDLSVEGECPSSSPAQ